MRKVKVVKFQGSYRETIFESSGLKEDQLILDSTQVIKENNKSIGRKLTVLNVPKKRIDSNTHIYNVLDYEHYRDGLPTLCYNIVISDIQ